MAATASALRTSKTTGSMSLTRQRGTIILNIVLVVICLAWTIPTLGLLVSSFRTRDDIAASGWWTVLPHQEWTTVQTLTLPRDTALDGPINVNGTTFSDDQLRNGVTLPSGQHAQWASRRQRTIYLQELKWAVNWNFTTVNYDNVITGQQYTFKASDG